jgi:hypothetical protein
MPLVNDFIRLNDTYIIHFALMNLTEFAATASLEARQLFLAQNVFGVSNASKNNYPAIFLFV